MRPKVSPIWRYFTEVDDNNVRCTLCNQKYSRKGRGTSALRSHLKSRHEDQYTMLMTGELKTSATETLKRQNSESLLQQAKKQMTLQEPTDESKYEKSHELDNLLCEMLALEDLPFNFIEGDAFRRFLHAAHPQYYLRNRQYYISHLCNYIYPKMTEIIKCILINLRHLSFTTDTWTSPGADVALLSFRVHGINEDFQRVSLVLKCGTLEERLTSDVIAQKIDELREEWGIPRQKVHVMIRDGGSNKNRSAHVAQLNGIDCTIQQLELCVQTALAYDENISTLLVKCKQIATHFNHAVIGQTEVRAIQKRLGLSVVSLIQDCPTRWNNILYMIQYLIEIKDAIVLHTSQHCNLAQLSPTDWLQLKNCVKILNPFDEATKTLNSSEACISFVIPLIHVLTYTMHNLLSEASMGQDCQNLIQKCIEELNDRFNNLHYNNLYSVATYLDPKYKMKFFNEIIKDRVESKIISLINENKLPATANEQPDDKTQNVENRPSTSTATPVVARDENRTLKSMLADMLTSASNSDDENNKSSCSLINRPVLVKSLLADYIKEKRLNITEDSLSWWKTNPKYLELYGVVRQYLSAPPSSCPKEHLFSSAGLVNNELGNRLSREIASKLLFVKFNLPVINFQYKFNYFWH